MKQYEFVTAYKTIEQLKTKLKNKNVPGDISYALFKVKRMLQPHWDFQLEEEQKILDKYQPENVDNTFKFKSNEDKTSFFKDLNQLAELEINEEVQKVKLHPNSDVPFGIEDYEALEPFMDFE